jgi:hypothetical protein
MKQLSAPKHGRKSNAFGSSHLINAILKKSARTNTPHYFSPPLLSQYASQQHPSAQATARTIQSTSDNYLNPVAALWFDPTMSCLSHRFLL